MRLKGMEQRSIVNALRKWKKKKKKTTAQRHETPA
jgi:hypothetical protein